MNFVGWIRVINTKRFLGGNAFAFDIKVLNHRTDIHSFINFKTPTLF